jgi:hypothetical protein
LGEVPRPWSSLLGALGVFDLAWWAQFVEPLVADTAGPACATRVLETAARGEPFSALQDACFYGIVDAFVSVLAMGVVSYLKVRPTTRAVDSRTYVTHLLSRATRADAPNTYDAEGVNPPSVALQCRTLRRRVVFAAVSALLPLPRRAPNSPSFSLYLENMVCSA